MTAEHKATDLQKQYHVRRIADGCWLKLSRGKLLVRYFGRIRYGAHVARGGAKLDAWLAGHPECEAVEKYK